VTRRSDALPIAVLGLLHDSPLHGYELRKRLDVVIGALRRRISFGSLYPALRELETQGWITQSDPTSVTPPLTGRRARVVYQITGAGEEHLRQLLATSGPAAWEDEEFDVHFAFFGRTDAETRLRILEGRRTRMQERLERGRQAAARTVGKPDTWAAELARHSQESVEREVRWLDDLIDRERADRARRSTTSGTTTSSTTSSIAPSSTTTTPNSEPTGELSTNQ
jgi:DNA-binding PadR family transcriptional regulator